MLFTREPLYRTVQSVGPTTIPRMVSRLHALLVALLLCCCGLLAPAAASPDRTAPGMQADAAATERAIDRFSVSDPMTQGQAESAADGPGLPAATPLPTFAASSAALLRPYADGLLRPPYLDGLQRPPRATALVA